MQVVPPRESEMVQNRRIIGYRSQRGARHGFAGLEEGAEIAGFPSVLITRSGKSWMLINHGIARFTVTADHGGYGEQ